MRSSRQSWAVVAELSRSVAERAITEKEACFELWARTGGDPRAAARAIRAGVRLFEAGAPIPTFAAGLDREVRRLREARGD